MAPLIRRMQLAPAWQERLQPRWAFPARPVAAEAAPTTDFQAIGASCTPTSSSSTTLAMLPEHRLTHKKGAALRLRQRA
ncbi:hypothetical protein, partial [Pantoea dispersa]|uniref:hypothetical protein n=1 Tax=Pantoea dispersa TaxID=59814 RepID=UPI001C6602C7